MYSFSPFCRGDLPRKLYVIKMPNQCTCKFTVCMREICKLSTTSYTYGFLITNDFRNCYLTFSVDVNECDSCFVNECDSVFFSSFDLKVLMSITHLHNNVLRSSFFD